MENRLKEYLSPDEKIIWEGQPESFELMDSTHKQHYIQGGIISALVCVALLIVYALLARYTESDIKLWFFLLVLVAGAYIAISPILDGKKLSSSKIRYLATDSRLIISTGGDFLSAAYELIPQATLAKDADGHTSLLCGEDAMGNKDFTRRSACLAGSMSNYETGTCISYVMYAIDNVESLKKALEGHLALS